MTCGNPIGADRAGRSSAERGEAGDEGIENAGAQGKEMKLALAVDLDEAGGFQFLDVMGEGCGGDGERRAKLGAAQGTGGPGDAFEKLKPLGIGERFQQCGAAGAGEAGGFGWISRR